MKETTKQFWILSALAGSPIIALMVLLVAYLDRTHDYWGLFLILSPVGILVAVIGLVRLIARRLSMARQVAGVVMNIMALGFWAVVIFACTCCTFD